LKRYREAELTHGRVAMLATVGFLVGEKVEGSSFLFDASIKGPAISHLAQVPAPFWTVLVFAIAKVELDRAQRGWVSPSDVPVDQPGLLRADYIPGDLAFDPLGLKPKDEAEFVTLQTKELQNGRLAMLAAAGFMAQELADGKGIFEHFSS
jgi:Chlorophyll A-B binding protein